MYHRRCRRFIRVAPFLLGAFIFSVVYIYYEGIYDQVYIFYLEKLQRDGPVRSSFIRTFNSTCSAEADSRGPGQKVIAYSIYGDFSDSSTARRYLSPLEKTVNQVIPAFFPGWIVRIYHNSPDDESLRILQQKFPAGSHVCLCNATQVIQELSLGDLFPMTWRFLPLLDDTVDILMSRDADSSVSQREVDAVKEWLESESMFHAMRDAHHHCRFYMLGGMWGVKLYRDRFGIGRNAKRMLSGHHYMKKGYDQILLRKHLWYQARLNIMVHDSYCCLNYDGTIPFPTQRKDRQFFVGMIGEPYEGSEKLKECPLKCRKQPDWIYC